MADKYTIANPFREYACTQTSAPPHSRVFGGETSADYDRTLGTNQATEPLYLWFPVGSHRYTVLDIRGACYGEYGDVDNGGGRAIHFQVEYWNVNYYELLGTVWFVHVENVAVTKGSSYGNSVMVGYTKKNPSVCATGQHVHIELTAAGARTAVLYTGNPAAYADIGSL